MVKSKTGKKKIETSRSYVALKSDNEIYYQMASIFKEAAIDGNQMAEDVLKNFLTTGLTHVPLTEVSLENSF